MKKCLVLLCTFALIFGVLCACTKNEPVETSPGSSVEQNTSAQNGTAAEESKGTDKTDASSTEKEAESTPTDTTQSTAAEKEWLNFPAFDAEDIFGAKVSSEVFEKNKLTVVNVFTTWCGPCIEELPILAKLDRELDDIGFIGIVVDINEGDGINEGALRTAKELCNDSDADYPYIVADESLTEFCRDIYYVPTTYFVDSNGRIVGDTIVGANTAEEWKEVIENKLEML